MKKIILITIMSLAFFTSCNDALEILPNDDISEEIIFENTTDLQNGMNGVYNLYNPFHTIDYSSNFVDDTRIGADNGGQKVNFHNWVLQSNSAEARSMWRDNYRAINLINRILDAAGSITPDSNEQAQYNKILGDCYALRAYMHLELLAYYGVDFDSGSEGVPYADFVVVLQQLERNTSGEVFAKIYEDLDRAQSLIDASFTDVGFVTRDFVTAVRARAALYEGNSSVALTATQNLIAKYPLANQSQYTRMFTDDTDNTEVIFKLYRTDGNNDQRIGGVWYFTGTGGAFIEMSNGFHDLITSDPSDIRSNVNVDPMTDAGANPPLLLIGKYPGKGGFDYLNDVKLFRVSEMYLIRAEILAKGSDFGGAADLIKQIRDARTGTTTTAPSFGNLADAMDEILLERRKELAYEGHRYVDLKRTRSITNSGMERDPADCGGATPCNLVSSDYRWTFPIHIDELNGNPNISQAPGY